jgi:cytochrome c553
MKNLLVAVAAIMLAAFQGISWAGDAEAKAEVCIECHDVEEFEGMDGAAIMAASKEATANNQMMAKATAEVSAEDLQEIADYLAAEANK